MTKIDIFSGFLGAGKTTLIKKLIAEGYNGEKLVLIENEFGEIGIDGGFLKDAGIEITEMNSGCICCSLVGDFGKALQKVLDEYSPDRILIEPSGVGKLSDVLGAVEGVCGENVAIGGAATVVDATKCKMYMKNFGEFFNNQIEHANSIILSHTENMSDDKIAACVELLREHNSDAVIVTTPWGKLDGAQLRAAIEKTETLQSTMEDMIHSHIECHEHHHDGKCGCEHHHHEHHHHDEECGCEHHHHEHHHKHDEECSCGCGGHHHHHADEVFESIGIETAKKYTKEQIEAILDSFVDESEYGMVLRAKGIVAGESGEWIHFDYVPGEADVRTGSAEVTGRICVIGSKINKDKINKLFNN